MAKGYSLDLRQRVWSAWQRGEGQPARTGPGALPSACPLCAIFPGVFEPAAAWPPSHTAGGQPLKADAKMIRRLQALVAKHNDLTYDEYHRRLCVKGTVLSRSSVGRLLVRLDLTRKKRRSKTTKPAASA